MKFLDKIGLQTIINWINEKFITSADVTETQFASLDVYTKDEVDSMLSSLLTALGNAYGGTWAIIDDSNGRTFRHTANN